MTWKLLADAISRIASASDDQLSAAVAEAFTLLTGQPAVLRPVAPIHGPSFELSDGPNLFGHVVCDLVAVPESVRNACDFLARYAAARFEAARLRQEATQLRAIVDAAGVALTVADTQRRTLYGNAGLLKLSGYTLEELNAVPPSERIHADDIAAVEA